jgi:hypothetical protein
MEIFMYIKTNRVVFGKYDGLNRTQQWAVIRNRSGSDDTQEVTAFRITEENRDDPRLRLPETSVYAAANAVDAITLDAERNKVRDPGFLHSIEPSVRGEFARKGEIIIALSL